MKRKQKIDLVEVLDHAIALIEMQASKKIEVPSFIKWVDEVIKQNKTKSRNRYEKNRGSSKSI
jgi:hypothetical protein